MNEMGDSEEWEWYISLTAKTTYRSAERTSYVLEGIAMNRTAAHPIKPLFSYNFDANGEALSFEKLYTIDDALYDAFAAAAERALTEEWKDTWPAGLTSFSESLCSKEDFIRGLREESWIQWFYTDEGIAFSYSVPFAIGGHKEATVPYSFFQQKTGDV